MCRIVGEIDFNKSGAKHITLIDDMRDTMVRGGPDDFGSWGYENDFCRMALGHRRLSIIDISRRGHQPMISDDGNIIISYNGEIYNYKELKSELMALGMKFETNSDTEVDGLRCFAEGSQGAFTYSEANEYCSTKGMRLCSMNEM